MHSLARNPDNFSDARVCLQASAACFIRVGRNCLTILQSFVVVVSLALNQLRCSTFDTVSCWPIFARERSTRSPANPYKNNYNYNNNL